MEIFLEKFRGVFEPILFVATFSLRTLCNDGHIVTCDEIGLVTVVTGHGVRVSRELRDCDSAQ